MNLFKHHLITVQQQSSPCYLPHHVAITSECSLHVWVMWQLQSPIKPSVLHRQKCFHVLLLNRCWNLSLTSQLYVTPQSTSVYPWFNTGECSLPVKVCVCVCVRVCMWLGVLPSLIWDVDRCVSPWLCWWQILSYGAATAPVCHNTTKLFQRATVQRSPAVFQELSKMHILTYCHCGCCVNHSFLNILWSVSRFKSLQ